MKKADLTPGQVVMRVTGGGYYATRVTYKGSGRWRGSSFYNKHAVLDPKGTLAAVGDADDEQGYLRLVPFTQLMTVEAWQQAEERRKAADLAKANERQLREQQVAWAARQLGVTASAYGGMVHLSVEDFLALAEGVSGEQHLPTAQAVLANRLAEAAAEA